MLIRHVYKSSAGNEITFYSLYQHLSFEGGQKISEKTQTGEQQQPKSKSENSKKHIEIRPKEEYKFKGIYGYKDANFSETSKIFIPIYTKVTFDKERNKISFTDGKNNYVSDVYIKEESKKRITQKGKIVGEEVKSIFTRGS